MKTMALISMLGTAIFAGCSASSQGGLVTTASMEPQWQHGPRVGLEAPEVRFTGPDGEMRRLKASPGWVTVVGFVAAPTDDCCAQSPALTDFARRGVLTNIRVVQITRPGGECPHGIGCFESCHDEPLRLIGLCDTDGRAWRSFGEPTAGTVILLDDAGTVREVSTMDELPAVRRAAEDLAQKMERSRLTPYQRLYMD